MPAILTSAKSFALNNPSSWADFLDRWKQSHCRAQFAWRPSPARSPGASPQGTSTAAPVDSLQTDSSSPLSHSFNDMAKDIDMLSALASPAKSSPDSLNVDMHSVQASDPLSSPASIRPTLGSASPGKSDASFLADDTEI